VIRAALACLLCCCLLAPGAQAAKLRLIGIDGELRNNVEAYIGPKEETGRMSFRALARHVDTQARDALRALGYYHPQITIERRGSDEKPILRATIDPGEPVRLRRVDVQFSAAVDPQELVEFVHENAPKRDDILHHGKYESFKTQLLQQAMTLGYFQAAWTAQQVRVDDHENVADVLLAMSLGPRHRLGETTVVGSGIAPELVARFPRFRAGDWYDGGKLAELHRDLVRTGWFEKVRIRADPEDAQDLSVPVNVEYSPRKKNRVGIGAGFSTDIGPRVQLQWEKPWLNPRGHSLQTYLELSEIRTQFEAAYLVPLADPVTSQLAYTYGIQFEDLNDHDYWLTTAGIEHRKRLKSKWRLIRGIDLERETDDFGLYETSSTLLMPGIGLTRVESDGVPLVSRGWRATGKYQLASDALLSDTTLHRVTVDAKGIHDLGSNTRIIARTGGGALATDEILDIPVSLRFFAGGDQSVRGYDYESLGPRDALGNLVGGIYQAEASIEFDYRFAQRWLVAAFADRGAAFNGSSDADFVTGVGAGIRWLSPIGPLRLDFAWGVSADDVPFNVHFYMGPEL